VYVPIIFAAEAVSRKMLQHYWLIRNCFQLRNITALKPPRREFSEIFEFFETLPRLCKITWRFQATGAFTVLNLRKRLAPLCEYWKVQ